MSTEKIYAQLREKQQELTTRIAAIEADFNKGRSQDFAEQATESGNDGVLDEIHHEAKIELAIVKQALQQIKAGNYGYCTCCSQAINIDRLTALPYTTKCIECA